MRRCLLTAMAVATTACAPTTVTTKWVWGTDTGAGDGSGTDGRADTGTPRRDDTAEDTASDSGPDDTGDTACSADATGWLPTPEGALLEWDAPLDGTHAPCQGATHSVAGPIGATLEVQLDAWTAGDRATIQIEDTAGNILAGPSDRDPGEVVAVVLPRSGEVLVRVQPREDDAGEGDYTLTATCRSRCDAEYTRHPIVLMHGMAGDDAWLGVVDYFVGVESHLAESGFLAVAPGVDAFGTPETRAAQWQAHLDALEAEGVGRKFVLIGHSQGGIDARYLASVLEEDRVAAIVTVGTPHRGTAIADLGAGLIDAAPGLEWAVDAAIDLLATFLGLGDGDLSGQVTALSRPAMAEFNEAAADVDGIYYASWAGKTCSRLDWSCRRDSDGEYADTLFDLTTTVLAAYEGDNDGLVSVDSAKWGDFRGVVFADHIDQIGITDPLTAAPLDHEAFYLAEARRLAALGF